MSWISMLSWWQWLIMASVPPLIVMLYFLKLRRQSVQVPSTYLWRRTIEDLHVNSIWQRLRKNLLLLLQLLAVGMLILACLRPGTRGLQSLGSRSIILIDNSGSMQATDVGSARLEVAKRRAIELIDSMASDDVAMVIAFSDRADVRREFSGDRRRLREAVESIQPTNRTTDLHEALRAASGLANPGRTSQIEDIQDVQVAEALPAKLFILSDGGFAAPQMSLGNLTAEFLPIGEKTTNNVGIQAFSVERNIEKEGQVQAFARIRNFSETTQSLTASLSLDDGLVDAVELQIEPNGENAINFDVRNATEGRLRLEIEHQDDLSLDNVAYAGLDPPRQLEVVVVTAGNTALRAALGTAPVQALASIQFVDPAQLGTPEFDLLSQTGKVDLFVFDQCAPPKLPQANTLFLGTAPPGNAWTIEATSGPLFVIDSNRAHPIMQYVDMGSVLIFEGHALKIPPGATELLRTDLGVLMAVAPRDAYQDAVLGLALTRGAEKAPNTDWPIKRSFPVFLLNCLEYLGGAVSTAGAKSIQPGQHAALNIASRFEKVRVSLPNGQESSIDRAGQPRLEFTQTELPGFYTVMPADSDRVLQMFAVNLFSQQESDIRTANQVRIGEGDIAAATSQKITRHEYWRWILFAALLILFAEWVLYIRRIAV